MSALTQEQRLALEALERHLKGEKPPVTFDMTFYYHDGEQVIGPRQAFQQSDDEREKSRACAIGQAVFVPELPSPDKKLKSWGSYGTKVFGVEPYTIGWDFLFSGQWATMDNTAIGAAQRIRYFLDHCADKPRQQHFSVLGNIGLKPEIYQAYVKSLTP